MSANVPALGGEPCSRPVVGSNTAQAGRLRMENVRACPSGSLAVGVKLYDAPTTIEVAGVPEMVGGRLLLDGAVTCTSNAGSSACALPSETQTTMPRCIP